MDINREEKLLQELPGILNWALEGLLRLINNEYKFTKSAKISELMNDIESFNNPMVDFINERLIYSVGISTRKMDVYEAYTQWSRLNNAYPQSEASFKIEFLRAMQDIYPDVKLNREGSGERQRCYVNISLKDVQLVQVVQDDILLGGTSN